MSKNLHALSGLFILLAFFQINLNAQCDGGEVATKECTDIAYACVNDGYSDYVVFSNHGNDSEEYIYLTTDTNNVILVINIQPYANFEEAEIGICRVWGLAYSGVFLGSVGDNAATAILASDCYDLSENFITIDRSEVESTTISTVDDENIIDITDNEEATFSFENTGNGTAKYVYVITKSNRRVVDFSFDGTYNFAFLEEGKYFVWGYSYSGEITREIGDKLRGEFSNGCYKRASRIVLVRKETDALPPITCFADAGTSSTDESPVYLEGGSTFVTVTANGDAVVPDDYELIYVLTTGAELTITRLGPFPSFFVSQPGNYRIHSFVVEVSDVNDENFFDATFLVLDQTTGAEVLEMIETQGVCADLDVVGAPVEVLPEIICTANAGVLIANEPEVVQGFFTIIEADVFFPPTVPLDYEVLYVLSTADGVIQEISDTPAFVVNDIGAYRVQALVAETSDPSSINYLNLQSIMNGTTTIGELNTLLETANVCAALDQIGADITVISSEAPLRSEDDPILNTQIEATNDWSVFPNPVVSTLNARLTLGELGSISSANLVITNIQGQVVQNQVIDLNKGVNEFQLSVASLARGMYQVQIYNKEQQWVERFYKH